MKIKIFEVSPRSLLSLVVSLKDLSVPTAKSTDLTECLAAMNLMKNPRVWRGVEEKASDNTMCFWDGFFAKTTIIIMGI